MRRGPHWLLSDQDSKAYGKALANALRHLPITMAQKWIDFSALGLAIFAYETPRIGMDIQLKQQAQARRQQPQPMGQVFQFRPAAPPPSAAPQPSQQPPQPSPQGAATAPAGDMTYEPELGEPA